MKKLNVGLSLLLFLSALYLWTVIPQAQRYDGPKARLAVGDFRDLTAGGGMSNYMLERYGIAWKEIGEGMRDMLSTALFNTNRFIVLEREKLEEVLKEQDLGASGRVKKGTEAPIGEIYGADLIIMGNLTEFSGGTEGSKGDIEIMGVRVDGGADKAHIALDIRIVDAKTSQIVAATSVEGSASSLGLEGSIDLGGNLPISLGRMSKTPTEKAIRICIQKAVEQLVSIIPKAYYRH